MIGECCELREQQFERGGRRTRVGGIEQINHGNDCGHEYVVELDAFVDDAKHDIWVLGVRVGAVVGAERINILCADVDVSLLGPSDAGAVMDGGVCPAMADTRVVADGAVEGREDSDPFVPASSSYEASEVDGFIDVGWRFGVEHPLPRGSFGQRSTPLRSQEAVSVQRLRVDGPASPEAFGDQFASADESAHLHMGNSERSGGLVDAELFHASIVELIR